MSENLGNEVFVHISIEPREQSLGFSVAERLDFHVCLMYLSLEMPVEVHRCKSVH